MTKKDSPFIFVRRFILLFLFGAFCYGTIEILWRGYTHFTMLILGGICLLTIFCLEATFSRFFNIIERGVLYSVIITADELLFGMIFNKWLGLAIWDYSKLPYNFCGQICLSFSVLWFFIAVLCIYLCKLFMFAFE